MLERQTVKANASMIPCKSLSPIRYRCLSSIGPEFAAVSSTLPIISNGTRRSKADGLTVACILGRIAARVMYGAVACTTARTSPLCLLNAFQAIEIAFEATALDSALEL